MSLDLLSRPDAHHDHRYVFSALVFTSPHPESGAFGHCGIAEVEESAEKDLSVWGSAWNNSALRVCSLALLAFPLLLLLVLLLLGFG